MLLVAMARTTGSALPLVANARMYSSSPAAAAAWGTLLDWVTQRAGGHWTILDYPFPRPLDALWERQDLGCTQMCGLPYASRAERPVPIVAPVVRGARYGGKPIYFTDIVVRRDAPFQKLEDTFGGAVGYTVKNSQSGYVALREHLLPYRLAAGKPLYTKVEGPLVAARGVIGALLEGRIDVGPFDSYAHDLIRHLEPDVAANLRTIATTRAAPIPLFIATAPLDATMLRALRNGFMEALATPALSPARATLLLKDFAIPREADYDALRVRAQAAEAYPDNW